MVACCSNCYEKYIDKDGNIDIKRYCDLSKIDPKELDFNSICRCICHVDGSCVMH